MSVESTREVVKRYFDSGHTDLSMIAEDAVFTTMATGDETRGRDAIAGMLHHVYEVAFKATPEVRNWVFADGQAVLEADVVGTHTGEFAGVPATNKQVRIPLCVVYDLENDMIKRARVYLEVPVFLRQVGVA